MKYSSVAVEFRAAVATFIVMAYIIFANSSILAKLADSVGASRLFSRFSRGLPERGISLPMVRLPWRPAWD